MCREQSFCIYYLECMKTPTSAFFSTLYPYYKTSWLERRSSRPQTRERENQVKIIITLKALVIIINEAYEQEHRTIQPIEQTKKWCKAKVKILTTSTTYLSTIALLLLCDINRDNEILMAQDSSSQKIQGRPRRTFRAL